VLKKGLERSQLIDENLNLRRQVSEKAAFRTVHGAIGAGAAPVQTINHWPIPNMPC
jgi:hypothetical protein